MADFWSMVCLIGLWGWIAAAMAFIVRAFPERGVFLGRKALPIGAALVFFFSLWIAGMYNA